MNALGISLLWIAVQTGLLSLLGAGLYLVARRPHPVLGAYAAGGVLTALVCIPLLACSPWPRWTADDNVRPVIAITNNEASAVELPDDKHNVDAANAAVGFRRLPQLLLSISGEARQFSRQAAQAPGWRWPAWLAGGLLVGVAIGVTRIAIGFVALFRLRRATVAILDGWLLALVDELTWALACGSKISVRAVTGRSQFSSPAVIGWRRPTILLPADWREWDRQTCRAILAHELAHVARRDFAMSLVARLGAALHFYNPLVHWLGRRLRLEQELAADLAGAAVAGGAQCYLAVLGHMALHEDNVRPCWAGSPFLPTPGTLMRRIEMLARETTRPPCKPSRLRRAALATTLLAGTLAIAGLRGPTAQALGDTPEPTTPTAPKLFDMTYLPGDAFMVASIRPIEIGVMTLYTKISVFPGAMEFTASSGASDDSFEVEECLAVGFGKPPVDNATSAGEMEFAIIYRTHIPLSIDVLEAKIFRDVPPTRKTAGGHECLQATSTSTRKVAACVLLDEYTFAMLPADCLDRFFANQDDPKPAWFDKWQTARKSPLAMAVAYPQLLADIGAEPGSLEERLFMTIIEQMELVLIGATPREGGLDINLTANCKSPVSAGAFSLAAKALVALGTQMSKELVENNFLEDLSAPEVIDLVQQTIAGIKVDVDDRDVRVTARIGHEVTDAVVDAFKAQGDRLAAAKQQEPEAKEVETLQR